MTYFEWDKLNDEERYELGLLILLWREIPGRRLMLLRNINAKLKRRLHIEIERWQMDMFADNADMQRLARVAVPAHYTASPMTVAAPVPEELKPTIVADRCAKCNVPLVNCVKFRCLSCPPDRNTYCLRCMYPNGAPFNPDRYEYWVDQCPYH